MASYRWANSRRKETLSASLTSPDSTQPRPEGTKSSSQIFGPCAVSRTPGRTRRAAAAPEETCGQDAAPVCSPCLKSLLVTAPHAGPDGGRDAGGMAGKRPIIVHLPSPTGGRRVRVDGEILGLAHNVRDLVEFLRRAGLEIEPEQVADSPLIDWRGMGPDRWEVETRS